MWPGMIPQSWIARKRLYFTVGFIFGLLVGLLACEGRHILFDDTMATFPMNTPKSGNA
jgi:hypothetical protein